MTIDAKCNVCKNPDRRRMIEAAWNVGMQAEPMARVLDVRGINANSILKHLKEHSDGDGNIRAIQIEPVKPARERVMALQQMQLDEIERRLGLAQARADAMNKEREGLLDANGNPFPMVDASDFYDILGKDAQAAIGSILKTQGLTDKREAKTADLKLGLFEAMTNAGLAPKSLVGALSEAPQIGSGDDDAD
jgi:hypothetical protein